MQEAMSSGNFSGDGVFTKKCHQWFAEKLNFKHNLLTTSCSMALDMAALVANIEPGDEVIMPSFTFVSTANSFVLRGAKIKFVDIRPDTMNIDEAKIEQAITKKTKAIVPVHYAGISCEMDAINEIAKANNLLVIEDAAQGVHSSYKGQALGGIGDYGCYSFHATKNYTSAGEGGLLIVKDEKNFKQSEVVREKGTNRSQFLRGFVDKYTWVDAGSSFLPSDITAAYLYAQLENYDKINSQRMKIWNRYNDAFSDLEKREAIRLPFVPVHCEHNAHMFYLKVKSEDEMLKFIAFMKSKNISTPFHYVPLHSSPAGRKFSEFVGEDKYTTSESAKLVRLPLYYSLSDVEQDYVIGSVKEFFN